MIPGIDVSNWQGQVDWHQVAQSGRQFAFAKATEGIDFVDKSFPANWAGIKAAGLVRGAYHFARPDQNRPDEEVDFFLQQVRNAGGLETGDLLALDLEFGSGNLATWTLTWLNRVTDAVGFRPLLYSGTWFLDPHGGTGNAELAQHALWLASYRALLPTTPASWSSIAVWQHTDHATVPGVAGPCDESFFTGDNIDLLKQLGQPEGAVSRGSPAVTAGPSVGDYVVRSGDTLSAIAAAHGCNLADLETANPQIGNFNLINVGEVIHLPRAAQATQTFIVRSGDNLSAIASRLGVSLLALERANPQLQDPNVIRPGELLNVP